MISINTNTGSLYVRQAMGLNNRGLASAMEQLSTGKQLNNASDNVAGMAISTGLAAQIKALNQAVRNANDGLSVLATADSSLAQISNMLKRMRDLSSESVSTTNSEQDRDALNREFQQLKTQINKVTSTTQWNGIDVLNGVVGGEWDGKFNFQVGSNGDQTVGVEILNLEQTPPIYVTGGNNLDKTFRFNSGVTPWTPTGFDPGAPLSYDSADSGWDPERDDPFASHAAAWGIDSSIPQTFGSIMGSRISLNINGVQAASIQITNDDLIPIGGDIGGLYWDPTRTPGSGETKLFPAGTELSETLMLKLATAFGTQAYDGTFLTASFDTASHTLKVGYSSNRDGGASVITPLADGSLSEVAGDLENDGLTVGDDNFTVSFGGLDGWAHAYVSPQERYDLTILDTGNSTSKTAQDQLQRVITAKFSNGRGPASISYQLTQDDIDAIDGKNIKLSETVAKKLEGLLKAYQAGDTNNSSKLTTIDATSEKGVLVVDWSDAHPAGFKASMLVESSLPLSMSDLTSSEEASYALANVDNALERLNLQRAKIGVAMSALQSRSESLGVQSVKTQEARSRIEDTEYAQATSNFAKRSIIQQAASAMLAQANQSPDLVLQLLKS